MSVAPNLLAPTIITYISSALPPGVVLLRDKGTLGGAPSVSGTYYFNVTAVEILSGETKVSAIVTMNVTDCGPYTCLNNGTCVDDVNPMNNNFTCICTLNFTGVRCDSPVQPVTLTGPFVTQIIPRQLPVNGTALRVYAATFSTGQTVTSNVTAEDASYFWLQSGVQTSGNTFVQTLDLKVNKALAAVYDDTMRVVIITVVCDVTKCETTQNVVNLFLADLECPDSQTITVRDGSRYVVATWADAQKGRHLVPLTTANAMTASRVSNSPFGLGTTTVRVVCDVFVFVFVSVSVSVFVMSCDVVCWCDVFVICLFYVCKCVYKMMEMFKSSLLLGGLLCGNCSLQSRSWTELQFYVLFRGWFLYLLSSHHITSHR